jgi:hypothetical protein
VVGNPIVRVYTTVCGGLGIPKSVPEDGGAGVYGRLSFSSIAESR